MKTTKIVFLSFVNEPKISGKTNPNQPIFGTHDYFLASWAGSFAKRFHNSYPDENIECWSTTRLANSIVEKKLSYGFNGILFPYKHVVLKGVFTYEMWRKLLKYQKEYNLILHYHNIFDSFSFFSTYFLPETKIILSHHGGISPACRKKTLKNRIKTGLIKLTYHRLASITYLTQRMRKYLNTIPTPPPLHFLPVGAQFQYRIIMDRLSVRRELGLDEKKIYGIYIGSYYRLKGVDLILELYDKFKVLYDFSVIFVGGNNDTNNELYAEVDQSGCPNFGTVPYLDITKYLNAANFYIHPAFDLNFGGLDVSWMEALACNIPVISPQLKELNCDTSELGIVINSKNELEERVEEMILNHSKYKNCRNEAIKLVDANGNLIERLNSIYNLVLNCS